jgi:formylglycine-generating enzyme required for sulfatase activity
MSRKNSVHRVLRGGSYYSDSWGLRASDRFRCEPEYRFRFIGFRIVFSRRKP